MSDHVPPGVHGAGNVGDAVAVGDMSPGVPPDIPIPQDNPLHTQNCMWRVPDNPDGEFWGRFLHIPSHEFRAIAVTTKGENIVWELQEEENRLKVEVDVDQEIFAHSPEARELLRATEDSRWKKEDQMMKRIVERHKLTHGIIYGDHKPHKQLRRDQPHPYEDMEFLLKRHTPIVRISEWMTGAIQTTVEKVETTVGIVHKHEKLSDRNEKWMRMGMKEMSNVIYDDPQVNPGTVFANMAGDAFTNLVCELEEMMIKSECALFARMLDRSPWVIQLVAELQELQNNANVARNASREAKTQFDLATSLRPFDGSRVMIAGTAMQKRQEELDEVMKRLKKSESVSDKWAWRGKEIVVSRKMLFAFQQKRGKKQVSLSDQLGIASVPVKEDEMEEEVQVEEANVTGGVMDVDATLIDVGNDSEEGCESDDPTYRFKLSRAVVKGLGKNRRCSGRVHEKKSWSETSDDLSGVYGHIVYPHDDSVMPFDESVIDTDQKELSDTFGLGESDVVLENAVQVILPNGRAETRQVPGSNEKFRMFKCMQCLVDSQNECTCGFRGYEDVDKWIAHLILTTNCKIVVTVMRLYKNLRDPYYLVRCAAGTPPKEGSAYGPVRAGINLMLQNDNIGDMSYFALKIAIGLRKGGPWKAMAVVEGEMNGALELSEGITIPLQSLRQYAVLRNTVEHAKVTVLGSEWQIAKLPRKGTVIDDPELAMALRQKLTFSEDELLEFDVKIKPNSFIKSNGVYYTPVAVQEEYKCKSDLVLVMGKTVHADAKETEELQQEVLRKSDGKLRLKAAKERDLKARSHDLKPSSDKERREYRQKVHTDNQEHLRDIRKAKGAKPELSVKKSISRDEVLRKMAQAMKQRYDTVQSEGMKQKKRKRRSTTVRDNPFVPPDDDSAAMNALGAAISVLDPPFDPEEDCKLESWIAGLTVPDLKKLLTKVVWSTNYLKTPIRPMPKWHLLLALLHPDIGCLSRDESTERKVDRRGAMAVILESQEKKEKPRQKKKEKPSPEWWKELSDPDKTRWGVWWTFCQNHPALTTEKMSGDIWYKSQFGDPTTENPPRYPLTYPLHKQSELGSETICAAIIKTEPEPPAAVGGKRSRDGGVPGVPQA